MLFQNRNKKLALLAVGFLIINTTQIKSGILPQTLPGKILTLITAIGVPSFIRLYTKGTPKELKFKTEINDSWQECIEDWKKILKLWNILNPEHRKEMLKLFEKRWIGTKLSLLDKTTKTITRDTEIEIKEKTTKCLSTGICGNIDAYLFLQLKNLIEVIGNVQNVTLAFALLYGLNKNDIKNWIATGKPIQS